MGMDLSSRARLVLWLILLGVFFTGWGANGFIQHGDSVGLAVFAIGRALTTIGFRFGAGFVRALMRAERDSTVSVGVEGAEVLAQFQVIVTDHAEGVGVLMVSTGKERDPRVVPALEGLVRELRQDR